MMNLKDAASYALEQLHEAGADDAAVIVTSGKIDELNIDGGEFSLMRSGFKSGLSLKAIKEQKTGNIHTNSCEKEAIDAAVKDCMAAVMAAQPDEAESIAPKAENMSFTAGVLTPTGISSLTGCRSTWILCTPSIPRSIWNSSSRNMTTTTSC